MKLQLQNLVKKFGEKTAVDITQLTIPSGGIVGLVGNNGAGKTTLFRLLLDLLRADEGTVEMTFQTPDHHVLILDPARSEDWKPYTGAYIDTGFLIDFLTPEEYFDFVGKANGIAKEEIDRQLALYEDFMGGEILGQKKFLRDFSAGNQQKIGIIGAMLNRPQLLVLDEPFNFLDPTSQNLLKRHLTFYQHESGATVLVSSHNLQHTVEISDRIVLMEKGKILKDLSNAHQAAEEELETYFEV